MKRLIDQHFREILVLLLRQKYGKHRAYLLQTGHQSGFVYTCLCPVHNDGKNPNGRISFDSFPKFYCNSCQKTWNLARLLQECKVDRQQIVTKVNEEIEELRRYFKSLPSEQETPSQQMSSTQLDLPEITTATSPVQSSRQRAQPLLSPSATFDSANNPTNRINFPDGWNPPSILKQTWSDYLDVVWRSYDWAVSSSHLKHGNADPPKKNLTKDVIWPPKQTQRPDSLDQDLENYNSDDNKNLLDYYWEIWTHNANLLKDFSGQLFSEGFGDLEAGLHYEHDQQIPNKLKEQNSVLQKDCWVFPVRSRRGRLLSFVFWRIKSKENSPKYIHLKNQTRDLFGLETLPVGNLAKIVLCEGVRDVAALRSAGFCNVLATLGSPSGHQIANLLDLNAQEFLLAFDNDQPGQNFTEQVGNRLVGAGKEVFILPLPPDQDPRDVPLEQLQIMEPKPFEATDGNGLDWQKLRLSIPEITKGIFEKTVEDFLEKTARIHGVDYSFVVAAFLSNLSIALGGFKTLNVGVGEDWKATGLLWVAMVAPSGFGKTHIQNATGARLLRAYQHEKYESHRLAEASWKESKEKSQEGAMTEKPQFERIYEMHTTLETLARLHEENPTGLGILPDELSSVLDGIGQYKRNVGSDKAKWLELWNGGAFSNPTSEQDRFLSKTFVPVCGGIQEDLLHKLINTENLTDGYAARFLYAYAQLKTPMPMSEKQAISSPMPEAMTKLFLSVLKNRNKPVEHDMTEEARRLLFTIMDRLEEQARQQPTELFSPYKKLITYVPRLALILHYSQNLTKGSIEERTAIGTERLIEYFLAGLHRAFEVVELNEKERNIKKILDKLKQLGGRAKKQQVQQPLKKSIPFPESSELIERMINQGFIRKIVEGREFFLELVH